MAGGVVRERLLWRWFGQGEVPGPAIPAEVAAGAAAVAQQLLGSGYAIDQTLAEILRWPPAK
jgi:hypothetical protein